MNWSDVIAYRIVICKPNSRLMQKIKECSRCQIMYRERGNKAIVGVLIRSNNDIVAVEKAFGTTMKKDDLIALSYDMIFSSCQSIKDAGDELHNKAFGFKPLPSEKFVDRIRTLWEELFDN